MKIKNIIIGFMLISLLALFGCDSTVAKSSTPSLIKVKTERAVKTRIKKVNKAETQQTQQGQPTQTIGNSELQYYFTKADQHPDLQLIKVIDSAKSTLDIAIYSLTKPSIVNAIINAKNRGVTVELMTDKIESKSKSESKELALLQNDGIPIKINSHSGLLHIKMTIVDKNIATTGSYNYSQAASSINDEILVIITDPKVAADFDNEFKSMWNNTAEYSNYD